MKWQIQRIKNIYHWLVSAGMVLKYRYPAGKLYVIGVTGTDGKTTTCTLIYEVLKAAGFKTALISTVEARIGNKVIETGLHTTNPDARLLQPLLRRMVNEGVTYLVLEVTAHGLDQYRVLGCNFKIGVLTNVTHEHLDDFITMERYRGAKLKLFENVKYAVLNEDESNFEYFKSHITDAKIYKYKKTKLTNINPALSGDYNRYNIGATEMVAKIIGVEKWVPSVITNFHGVPGRREEVKAGQNFKLFVDFAHTPNALEQVLTQLRKETKNKIILVFGCTGGRDKSKRPIMGEVAERLADTVIITSDDTRSENQDEIARQITAGMKKKPIVENDRRKAIEMAVKLAKPGDIVWLAGKGHEKTILIGKEERPWSDVGEAEKAIKELI